MSNTASVIILVARRDVAAIEDAYGKPDANDEGPSPFCRRLAYHAGNSTVRSALAPVIKAGIPVVGDIAPADQQPGYAFCAIDGQYHGWLHVHGQLCVRLREDSKGRLVVDRKDLCVARAFWKQHKRALDTIQRRCNAKPRSRRP
ncbi:MAG: hypothetical protein HUU46_19245 [Candidatus Hydrogenedentes bacterium]|nr:hypothetical protein [Candidatus Hydrogenedentota bacterium]